MTTIYNVPAKFPIRGMIELDKTPLTQDDLDWAHDYDLMDEKNVHPAVKVSVIQTRRLLGVVEGLKDKLSNNKAFEEISSLKLYKKEIDTSEIVSIVLQKLPSSKGEINKESIISEVLTRIPKMTGGVTYLVSPI